MILQADAKGLEWVAGTYLNQDPVAMQEIITGIDQHSLNQEAFKLPTRLIAKTFVFRLIYGGTAYAYVNDSEFNHVSTSVKYWDKVIERFYEKYQGWAQWHIQLVQEVTRTGRLVMPTGRVYEYHLTKQGDWPRTTILNYPVQGLGADLVAILRVAFYKRFKALKFEGKLIMTVHDSIVVDCPVYEVEPITKLFHEVFADGPRLFQAWFGKEFNLPLKAEVSCGPNMGELEEII